MAVAFINHHRRDLIGNFQSLSPSAIPSEPFTIAKALDPTPNSEMAQEQAIEAMPTAERMKMMPLVEGPPRKLAISNLMSPPEPARLDQFHQTVWSSMPPVHAEIRQPLSPPISPLADKSAVPDHTHSPNQAADPILYPSPDRASSPRPLFLNESSRARLESARLDGAVVRKTVDAHMAARSSSLFRAVSPPGRDDYELVLYFKSDVMAQYSKDPKSWLERERALLRADQRANQDPNKMTASVRKPISTRISKPAQRRSRPHTFDGDMPMLDHHKSRPHDHERANIERPIRVAPAVHVGAQPLPKKPKPLRKISTTPEPRARIVAPNREDKDFDKLPDCCPPLNTLPNNPTCLKVEWKGNPLNLDDDPHRNLLHPAELNLASKLRLDCATYLTSKRRIFLRLVECVKIGKEFRKTDAQQACKIDVNKASKLWMAYEQVGWLDRNRVKRLAMDERFAMVPAQGQWGLGQH